MFAELPLIRHSVVNVYKLDHKQQLKFEVFKKATAEHKRIASPNALAFCECHARCCPSVTLVVKL